MFIAAIHIQKIIFLNRVFHKILKNAGPCVKFSTSMMVNINFVYNLQKLIVETTHSCSCNVCSSGVGGA